VALRSSFIRIVFAAPDLGTVIALDTSNASKGLMLRITTDKRPQHLVLRLEGRLEGPWVAVLDQCFRIALTRRRGRRLFVDLAGVTFADAAGKAQLAEMYAQGAELLGEDIETRAIVEEIRGGDGDGESRQVIRKAVVTWNERLTKLQRLQAELHEVNEELVVAARPLERLSEMSLEQRQNLADQIRAKLARWESVTREIQQVMGTSKVAEPAPATQPVNTKHKQGDLQ
jgi:anti-anti-sigma regulatory factor